MSVSGMSGSLLRAYAEHTIDARKDTRSLRDSHEEQALADAKSQVTLKDKANQDALQQKLFETIKAGAKAVNTTVKATESVGDTVEGMGRQSDLESAIQQGDIDALKAVKMDDTHTVGDALSDEEIKTLLEAPGAKGEPPTLKEQTGRILHYAKPERAALRDAVASGDIEQIKATRVSEHSTIGGRLSDEQIREIMAKPEENGSPPSVDTQTDRLMGAALEREVKPEQIRDTILGELDRVASAALGARTKAASDASGAAAKDAGQSNARKAELNQQIQSDGQVLTRLARLAADAQVPLVG